MVFSPASSTARNVVNEVAGEGVAICLRVLYDGSVNPEDIGSYVGLQGCDGCLSGGASIRADEFATMIRRGAADLPTSHTRAGS